MKEVSNVSVVRCPTVYFFANLYTKMQEKHMNKYIKKISEIVYQPLRLSQ